MDISVIIPTYNRKKVLRHTILSLINQNLGSYEVIVCDDGSDDGTREMIENLRKEFKLPFDLKYQFQKKIGFRAGAARNLGIRIAKGNNIVFLDQDVILSPGVLKLATHVPVGKTVHGIKMLTSLKFYDEKINDDVVLNNFDIFKQITSPLATTISSLGIITKEDLNKVEGFDEDFKSYGLEDTEFIDRLRDISIPCLTDNRIIGYHIEHEPNIVNRQMQDIYHNKRNKRKTKNGSIQKRAAILYLTHNRFEYTKQSLTSIIKNTERKNYDLLLWDNQTTENGMIDWLKKICKENQFDYVFSKKNAGLTTAMNQQMRIMRKRGIYDVFCHIANDVVVPISWLDAIFGVMKTGEVGCIGLNLEPNSNFEKINLNGYKLEKLRPECNVGGMHFCIPLEVYDLLGGFQHVEFGYGQQDANYSLKVKLMPNNWWVYYLDKDIYKGIHLGVNNALVLDEKNKDQELYQIYHDKMKQLLKHSGGDISGGRNFRSHLTNLSQKYKNKMISYEDLLKVFRVPESEFKNIKKEDILDTTINMEFFE